MSSLLAREAVGRNGFSRPRGLGVTVIPGNPAPEAQVSKCTLGLGSISMVIILPRNAHSPVVPPRISGGL